MVSTLDMIANNIHDEVMLETGEDLGAPPPGEEIQRELSEVLNAAGEATSHPELVRDLDREERQILQEIEWTVDGVVNEIMMVIENHRIDVSDWMMSPRRDV